MGSIKSISEENKYEDENLEEQIRGNERCGKKIQQA